MPKTKDQETAKPAEPAKLPECPSCLNASEITSPITLAFYNPPVKVELCPMCHTQAIRQPRTFRLRFNPRSGDHIRESVQEILDAAEKV